MVFHLPLARAMKRPAAGKVAGVAELVDALDLGSSDASRGGSNPSARTSISRTRRLLIEGAGSSVRHKSGQ